MDYTPLEHPASQRRGRLWYHAVLQVLSVILASTTVALFPTFSYKPWSLPATYSIKTSQQYVNFIVIGIALMVSLILAHCLSYGMPSNQSTRVSYTCAC